MTSPIHPTGRNRRALATCAAAMLAAGSVVGCGGGKKSPAPAQPTGTAGTAAKPAAEPFTVTLTAANHSPRVNKPWPIVVTARRKGAALSGSVSYQYLSFGQVVAREPGHKFTGGVFHDKLTWPADAVGHPLTLRVLVRTKYGTVHRDWAISVRN